MTNAVVSLGRGGIVGRALQVVSSGQSPVVAVQAAQPLRTTGDRDLFRITAWLRTGTPGVTVCLRMLELSPNRKLKVRTSESCTSPTDQWRQFEVTRRTLLRGDRLVFSMYSFSAFPGDTFELDGFTVERQVDAMWQEIGTSLHGVPPRPTAPGGMRDSLTR